MVINAVIGANYGDEGKGLVANALCRKASLQNKKVLNVLTNGGCQRGHTAYDQNGNRHVYSHFGAGYPYADICFSKYYMVNPMVFMKEYTEIKNSHKIFVDGNCTLTTPYDMLVNRMVENHRSEKHGSCGYGIWETVCRNKEFPIYWKDIIENNFCEIVSLLRSLRDNYFKNVINNYQIEMTFDEKALFFSEQMIANYAEDISLMKELTEVRDFTELINSYDEIVFENAQGLLLDRDLDKWGTPSKTGMAYIKDLVKGLKVTPYYVTRSYLTKHGNGLFPGETSLDKINNSIVDKTNHPNDYQGTLRYGLFDQVLANQLLDRIKADAEGYDYKIVVTHQNELQCEYLTFADYYSYNETDFQ